MDEDGMSQVVADVKDRAVCPRCETDTWVIDRRTLEQGDEPTEAECSECGYTIYT